MDPRELLAIKRDGGALSPEQSAEFLSAYTRGEIADYQAAVLLTSIFIHDMTDAELAGWARGNPGGAITWSGEGNWKCLALSTSSTTDCWTGTTGLKDCRN